MTMTRQRTYPEPVVKRLYALSGNRCAFPGCETRLTDQVAPGEPPTNLGKIAHIVGLGRQGPRADSAIPIKDLNRVENLLLLCGVHHDLVDANPRIYGVEVLAAQFVHKLSCTLDEPAASVRSASATVAGLSESRGIVCASESGPGSWRRCRRAPPSKS